MTSKPRDLLGKLSQSLESDFTVEELLDAIWYAAITYSPPPQVASEPVTSPQSVPLDTPIEPSSPSAPQNLTPPSIPESNVVADETPIGVYAPSETKTAVSSNLFLDIPDPPAINSLKRQQIRHTLQFLLRKTESKKKNILDEEATVQSIAETGLYEPILIPQSQRSLSLTIIQELDTSYLIWRKTLKELAEILKDVGIFHQIETYWLKVKEKKGQSTVALSPTYHLDPKTTQPPERILNGSYAESQNHLIVIISDFASPYWYQGIYFEILKKWSEQRLVTLLHLFPRRMWRRTAIDREQLVSLSSPPMGAVNRRHLRNQDLAVEGVGLLRTKDCLKLPLITLDTDLLRQWTNMVSGQKKGLLPGIVINKPKASKYREDLPRQVVQSLSPYQVLSLFRQTATESAQKLARRLAAVPVTFPIIRLIQTACGDASPLCDELPAVTLAEVLMGGLFEPLKLDSVELQFKKGIRELLTQQALTQKDLDTLEFEFKESLREDLRQQATENELTETIFLISNYIAEKLGQEPDTFSAILYDPQALKRLMEEAEQNPESLNAIKHFAQISASTLAELGGIYTEIANQYVLANTPPDTFSIPAACASIGVQPVPFAVEVTNLKPEEVLPKKLTFETVFVNKRGEIIETKAYEAYYYDEKLNIENSEISLAPLSKGENSDDIEVQEEVGSEEHQDYIRMIYIPEGEFGMGTEDAEVERIIQKFGDRDLFEREKPQHLVKVSAFYMSQTPITQAQWRAIAQREDLKVAQDLNPEPSHFKGDDRPVEQVNWYDSLEYCARLSKLTGRNYRLPSEAEWEYACRSAPIKKRRDPASAQDVRERSTRDEKFKIQKEENLGEDEEVPLSKGDLGGSEVGEQGLYPTELSSKSLNKGGNDQELTLEDWNENDYQLFHFGETLTSEIANYRVIETFAEEEKGQDRQETTPVRQFPPNAFGLYDMHGNVWEWCLDPWHGNYNGAPNDGRVWDENNNNNHYQSLLSDINVLLKDKRNRVVRGGSWSFNPVLCRSAYRFNLNPRGDIYSNLGLRVVVSDRT